jgi:hypothetical protein
VLSLLDEETIIERRDRGKIVSVDWERLLRRWASDAPFESRGSRFFVLDPRGVQHVLGRLKSLDTSEKVQYAVTGSVVANDIAPIAASRLLTTYVRNSKDAIQSLGLHLVEVGANVLLVEPDDDVVYVNARMVSATRHVAYSQAAADLLGSSGRGPAEGEALIEWMREHEEVWRG